MAGRHNRQRDREGDSNRHNLQRDGEDDSNRQHDEELGKRLEGEINRQQEEYPFNNSSLTKLAASN